MGAKLHRSDAADPRIQSQGSVDPVPHTVGYSCECIDPVPQAVGYRRKDVQIQCRRLWVQLQKSIDPVLQTVEYGRKNVWIQCGRPWDRVAKLHRSIASGRQVRSQNA